MYKFVRSFKNKSKKGTENLSTEFNLEYAEENDKNIEPRIDFNQNSINENKNSNKPIEKTLSNILIEEKRQHEKPKTPQRIPSSANQSKNNFILIKKK